MEYKEFRNWCMDRCGDGCWSINIALTFISISRTIDAKPFWKRNKIWKQEYEEYCIKIIKDLDKKRISFLEKGVISNE